MKSNVIFFLGLVAALGISWGGIVMGSNAQLGGLAPFYDDSQSNAFPQRMPETPNQWPPLAHRDTRRLPARS